MTGIRIFYADDRRENRGLHIASLKGQICAFHFAIYQAKALAVAQRLRTDDGTVFKGNVLAVPGKIFPLYHAIAHHHILCMPERILRVKTAIFKDSVLNILKRILSFKMHIVEMEIAGSQHKVLALCSTVLHGNTVNRPAKFWRDDVAIPHFDRTTLPQRLDAV